MSVRYILCHCYRCHMILQLMSHKYMLSNVYRYSEYTLWFCILLLSIICFLFLQPFPSI